VQLDESDAVHFDFSFPTQGSSKLRLHSAIINKLPADHRQYFTVSDPNGRPLGAWLIEHKNQSIDLPDLSAAPADQPRGFVQFFKLGVEHIVTGYDHLVFLLGLLIVGGRFVASLKIITAFTVAHSITLALATLELIRLSPRIVEPLIAASIIYVGIENIFRRDLERRWMLAFGFGLIHGCGFATVLRDLGVGGGGTGVAVPLLSFNLGVEAGQLVIASILLPIIWKLNERPQYQPRYVPACSVIIALAGTYWLVTRLLGAFHA
jgi:hydrogenase/urease accessory protein HupE